MDDLLELLDADLLDQPRPSLLALGPPALGAGSSASLSRHSPGFLRVVMMIQNVTDVCGRCTCI